MIELTPDTTFAQVNEKAVLLMLRLGMPGNSRKVKSTEITEKGSGDPDSPITVDADKTMLSVSKALLSSTTYQAVIRHDQQTKNYLKRRALPSYFRESFWLVPLALLEEIDAELGRRQIERQALIQRFLDTYETKVEEARVRLRELFSLSDYPGRVAIAEAFRWQLRYLQIQVPQTMANVSDMIFQREREKAEALWAEAAEQIQLALRTSMSELVEHMIDRLSPNENGQRKRYGESMVDAMEEFLTYFQARNVTNDEDLAALVEKAKQIMKGVDTLSLRRDANMRERVRDQFERVKALLDPMLSTRPIRAIRFDDE